MRKKDLLLGSEQWWIELCINFHFSMVLARWLDEVA